MLLNVGRRVLGQRGEGHFFLAGGLHAAEDRALLLEVNRWRYPSVWARVPLLHEAIQTTTPSGQPRGFLVVTRTAAAQRPVPALEPGPAPEPDAEPPRRAMEPLRPRRRSTVSYVAEAVRAARQLQHA